MTESTIVLDSPERVEYAQRVISRLPVADKAWDVVITPHKERRSNPQNDRLWKLHTLAAQHIGCSSLDCHEDMLCEYFGATEIKLPTGEIKRIPLKRSSQRDKAEFAAFMEFVETFYISKLGVFLGAA